MYIVYFLFVIWAVGGGGGEKIYAGSKINKLSAKNRY
jgi:hypothetical protein